MPLTKAQRRKINARNAQSSTGPNDTSRTRFNAMKHGLRAEVLCLPDEDPEAIRQRSESWNNFYQPQDPAEQHLVNECVRATLLSDRVDRFHIAEVSKQIRHAGPDWIAAQVDRREHFMALLKDDPAAAVIGLRRFGFGLLHLIGCWERLEQSLTETGYWDELERDEAIRLLSCRPDPETLKDNPEAWVTRLYNLICRPRASENAFEWLFDPGRLPVAYRERYAVDFVPDAETCRQYLRETVARELTELREQEKELEAEVEDFDYDESEARASILRDEKTARLFLRYHAESRTSFQRAYAALIRTIDARPEESIALVDPPLAKEADRVEEEPSPNEANPALEPTLIVCEASTSVESEAQKPKTQNGRRKGYDPKEDVGMVLLEMMYQERLAAERSEMVPISVVGAVS